MAWEGRGPGPHFEITHDIFFLDLVGIILLVLNSVNEYLSPLQSRHMLDLFAGQLFLELELNLIDIDSRFKHARLVRLEHIVQLLKTRVRR